MASTSTKGTHEMSRKTKLEVANEEDALARERAEQKPVPPQEVLPPAWTPTYPGEQAPLDLSPEEIASRESAKRAMSEALLGGYTPPSMPWRAEVATGAPVEVVPVAPIEPVAPGAVADAKARVNALQEQFRIATEAQAKAHADTLAVALKELGDLEVREAQSVDQQTSSRLADVLESIRESKVGDEVRAARVDAGNARQEDLRRRAAPALAIAAKERALYAAFKKEYGEMLDELGAIPRSDWLLGTASEGRGAYAASGIYANLDNGLIAIRQSRESLESALRTDSVVQREGEVAGGWAVELENLIKRAASGWDQNDERAWVWAFTRLVKVEGMVETLLLLVKGVSGSAARLRDLRDPANTERAKGIAKLPEPVNLPRVSDAAWSPFGEVR